LFRSVNPDCRDSERPSILPLVPGRQVRRGRGKAREETMIGNGMQSTQIAKPLIKYQISKAGIIGTCVNINSEQQKIKAYNRNKDLIVILKMVSPLQILCEVTLRCMVGLLFTCDVPSHIEFDKLIFPECFIIFFYI
jgi:hypothetical protein